MVLTTWVIYIQLEIFVSNNLLKVAVWQLVRSKNEFEQSSFLA